MTSQLNGSIAKAFAILRLLGEERHDLGARDLVEHLDMNGVTAHRFLKSLEAVGALVEVAKGRYRLGYTLVDLGSRAAAHDSLGREILPVLQLITNDLQEAAMATIYQAGMVVCIASTRSTRSLAVDIRVGDRLEAYCTAHGKLWLSQLPEAELDRYLRETRLTPLTSQTILDADSLLHELNKTRQQGYALNIGEREDGITALAVPVVSNQGDMVVGLSVFGPTSRIDEDVLVKARAKLTEAARAAVSVLYGNQN